MVLAATSECCISRRVSSSRAATDPVATATRAAACFARDSPHSVAYELRPPRVAAPRAFPAAVQGLHVGVRVCTPRARGVRASSRPSFEGARSRRRPSCAGGYAETPPETWPPSCGFLLPVRGRRGAAASRRLPLRRGGPDLWGVGLTRPRPASGAARRWLRPC